MKTESFTINDDPQVYHGISISLWELRAISIMEAAKHSSGWPFMFSDTRRRWNDAESQANIDEFLHIADKIREVR